MPFRRKKICRFCEDQVESIDYKDVKLLRRFVSDMGKIVPRRNSGACAKHQHQLTLAVKRARNISLLAYQTRSSR